MGELAMKIVRVRILVEISPEGKWNSLGYSGMGAHESKIQLFDELGDYVSHHWIEGGVPVPEMPPDELEPDDEEIGFGED